MAQRNVGRFNRPDATSLTDDGIIVLGAGGHAKVVISMIRAAGKKVASVYDDDPKWWGKVLSGVTVRGPMSELENLVGEPAIIAIGDNEVRKQIAQELQLDWATIIHPAAVVDPTAVVGCGSIVFAGAIVQPDAVIGNHCVMNTASTVDHDCRVGDFAHLCPGTNLAGNVHIESGVTLGTGACAIPGVRVGANTVVGAGAVVVDNLPGDVVAVGVPAKPIRLLKRAA